MGRVPLGGRTPYGYELRERGILTADWQPSSPHANLGGWQGEKSTGIQEEKPHRLLPFPTIRALLKGFIMISQRRMALARLHCRVKMQKGRKLEL